MFDKRKEKREKKKEKQEETRDKANTITKENVRASYIPRHANAMLPNRRRQKHRP